MKQSFEPINTVLGLISGRDAIYLDDVIFDYRNRLLELRGEINPNLCSNLREAEDSYIGYSLSFAGVIGISMIELDLSRDYGTSSFDRVINSDWIDKMRLDDYSSKVKPNLEHYLVSTYDDVFNIACESFELKILETRRP